MKRIQECFERCGKAESHGCKTSVYVNATKSCFIISTEWKEYLHRCNVMGATRLCKKMTEKCVREIHSNF
jgi:hypothetical protein